MSSATQPQSGARAESGSFTDPTGLPNAETEALRTYFVEGATAAEVAGRFGYTTSSLPAMVRDSWAGDRDLFVERQGFGAGKRSFSEVRPLRDFFGHPGFRTQESVTN